jgi:hypothetical protein
MKHISIGLPEDKPNQAAISISPDLDFNTAFLLLGTLAQHILSAYFKVAEHNISSQTHLAKKTKAAAIAGIKQSMYDTADSLFSNILNTFDPNSPRLSLEDEAILQLTNQLIEERYNELTPEEQAAYSKAYQGVVNYVEQRKGSQAAETDTTTADTADSTEQTR